MINIFNRNSILKAPLIPLFWIDKKFVTDIITKANIFNKFFAEQCSPLKNGNVLPSSQEFLTQERLCSLDFSNDEILKLIRSLDGHDDTSIRMIKICDKPLVNLLTCT